MTSAGLASTVTRVGPERHALAARQRIEPVSIYCAALPTAARRLASPELPMPNTALPVPSYSPRRTLLVSGPVQPRRVQTEPCSAAGSSSGADTVSGSLDEAVTGPLWRPQGGLRRQRLTAWSPSLCGVKTSWCGAIPETSLPVTRDAGSLATQRRAVTRANGRNVGCRLRVRLPSRCAAASS
jgi:hypothetical protein